MITKAEIVNLLEFSVSGVSIRTTNQNDQAMTDIAALWQRFMSEDIARQIPGKLSDDVYSVYTDYESDHTGSYTVVLGRRVAPGAGLTTGLTNINIMAGQYHLYTLEGEMPGAVVEAWQHIWETAIDRKYSADFEVYMHSGDVRVYVSVE